MFSIRLQRAFTQASLLKAIADFISKLVISGAARDDCAIAEQMPAVSKVRWRPAKLPPRRQNIPENFT